MSVQDLDRYAEIDRWSKELSIPVGTIRDRLKGIRSIISKTKDDRLADFYCEEDVRRVCADLLEKCRSGVPASS